MGYELEMETDKAAAWDLRVRPASSPAPAAASGNLDIQESGCLESKNSNI